VHGIKGNPLMREKKNVVWSHGEGINRRCLDGEMGKYVYDIKVALLFYCREDSSSVITQAQLKSRCNGMQWDVLYSLALSIVIRFPIPLPFGSLDYGWKLKLGNPSAAL
jgi:hypothetical protein